MNAAFACACWCGWPLLFAGEEPSAVFDLASTEDVAEEATAAAVAGVRYRIDIHGLLLTGTGADALMEGAGGADGVGGCDTAVAASRHRLAVGVCGAAAGG